MSAYNILGMKELVQNFSKFDKEALAKLADGAEACQAMVVNEARNNHPYVDRTENLTNSIQPGVIEVTDFGVTAFVEARMPYASFVELGTSRAHAYPFLVPAILRTKRQTMGIMAGSLKAAQASMGAKFQ